MSSKVTKNNSVSEADFDAEHRMFSAARKLQGSTRTDYLMKSCGDNESLLRRVEKLLAATEMGSGLLDRDFKSVFFELSDSGLSKQGIASSTVAEVVSLFDSPGEDEDILGRVAHYEVRTLIGRGAFGIVFKAFDEKLARLVAVKVLSPALARIPEYRERFLKEARAVASIQHDHVVRIHAVEESPFPFIVMELIDGETLQSHIHEKGPLPAKEITELSIQVVQGLAAAHKQGLVHLDVKPSNILLERVSDGTRAKLTDFGLALYIDDAGQVVPEAVLGTPAYMSPEQAKGEKIDQRADLFSFGSVVFAMCSGQAAFSGDQTLSIIRGVVETERAKLPDGVRIPKGFSRIINRLHSTLPEDRYRSANEVLDDLQRLRKNSGSRSATWKYAALATVLAGALCFAGFHLLRPAIETSTEKSTWSHARQQLVSVTDELEKVDKRFQTDHCKYEIEDGKLTFLHMPFAHDLSALEKLSDIEHLHLAPPGPLREVPVDLSFLDGMKKLRVLELLSFPAKSLEPLRGHQLERLHLWYSRINAQAYPAPVDLDALTGMPLNWLNIGGCGIESLQPLEGMELEFLCLSQSVPVSDLSPLDGMPLHTLLIRETKVSDLTPLIGSNLKILEISGSKVSDLSPLTHLALEELKILNLEIDDLSILKKCNIKALWMDYDISHEELVKAIPGLERLNGKPLNDYLNTVRAGN